MSEAPRAHRSSFQRRTLAWAAVLGAVFFTLLMVSPGFAFADPLGSGNSSSGSTTPAASNSPGVTVTKVQSGAALQNEPFLSNPSYTYATLNNTTSTNALASNAPIQFTIGFQPSNLSELQSVLAAQQTPGSPSFQHWLSQEQEMAMFGPNPALVQDTINYYTSIGFHVGVRSILSVSFSGTAGQVDQAFKTTESTVGFANGSSAIMNTLPLSVPEAIAPGIASINGLDENDVMQPTSYVDPALEAELGTSSVSLPLASVMDASTNVSTAFNFTNRAFLWFRYYSHTHSQYFTWQTITPGSLDYVYNATPLLDAGYNGNSTGSPITIAIVMAGGINPSDMRAYGQLVWNNPNNILDRLTPVPVDGAFTTNGTVTWSDGASGEMALDIEYSSTMAPGAHIMPVYGPCLCTNVLDDDYATIWNMARLPNLVSNSWGGDEDTSGNLFGPNFANDQTMNFYFMLLDARGATILASSADGGGFDVNTGILSGSFPATDPYVLSVDGIRTAETDNSGSVFPTNPTYGTVNMSIYTLLNQRVYVSEAQKLAYQSYWYQPQSNTTVETLPPEASGGFGTSYWFNQTWWMHAPVYSASGALTGSGPDLGRSLGSGVAAEADFNQTIFFDGSFEFLYGGTSFACPTTAGMFALVEDYLRDHGHSAYLGDGNIPVWWVGNAWENGNLTYVPYYSVTNGTSFWGNRGVVHGYSWPPGQKFPMDASGNTTYGDSLPGWNFPDGWGSLTVNNFAYDLNELESMPGTFMTTNSAGTIWSPSTWANLVLNQTYSVDVNATGVPGTSNPVVTLKFIPEVGTPTSWQITNATSTVTPSGGQGFQFNVYTGSTPFASPGLLLFEFGNDTNPSIGFGYSWVSYPLLPGGSLAVTVVAPTGTTVGGYPEFTTVPGISLVAPPIVIDPVCCTDYPNSLTVRVTYNGAPVYNALVTAQVPSIYSLAWQGSRMQNVSDSFGHLYEKSFVTVSQTLTNQTGYAIVATWNVIQPTTFFINASYSTATAGTTYQVDPGPNIATTDNYGGEYSHFDSIAWLLKYGLRQSVSPAAENLWVPNSVNQSSYYDMLYAWSGEELPVHVTDYQGSNLSNVNVWLGNLDLGGENKFYHYQATGGLLGVTTTPGTSALTDYNGNATVFIPDNETGLPFFDTPDGPSGLAWVAASVPGESNRTFSYTEPCAPTLPNVAKVITCQFNNTYQRNYTSTPLLVLPNPVNVSTQTTQRVERDFFGSGANISYAVNVSLPTEDPFLPLLVNNCFGCNWGYGLEHVVSVTAYVDGSYAGNLTPQVPPDWQVYDTFGNLTGTYAPGIHTLTVVVVDSLGHVFTDSHTFIVGSISITNLGAGNTYTVIPYTMNWTLNIPAAQVNNHTFNSSVEIEYLASGCGGTINPCPVVVNLTERIHDGVVGYNQSLNMTMLNLNHFYSGEDQLPPGQYQINVWLNANHSGSIAASVSTFFVFQAIAGEIAGPTNGALVPLGNVTIAYTYTGAYVENATLSVFPAGALTSPVFSVGAFVPGFTSRGGSATWPAVAAGKYEIVLSLGTPYGHVNETSNVTVGAESNVVYYNETHPGPLSSVDPALLGAILAVIGGVVGVVLGYLIGSRRGPPEGPAGAKGGPAQKPQAPTALECVTCHDRFETEFALHQHRRIVHGIED